MEKLSYAYSKIDKCFNKALVHPLKNIYADQQLFRALAENTNVAIFLYRDRKVIYVNPAFERMSGYSLEELRNGEGLNAIHPDQRKLIAERIGKRFAGELVPDKYELHFVTKSGEERWAELSVTLIDYENQTTGIVTGIDITERKNAEQQITHSESELRNIIDNLQDTYYRTDLQGRILRASKSVYDLLDYQEEELLGTKLSDLYVDPQGRENFLQLMQQNKGVVKNYEAALRRKDGSHVWVSTNAHYFFDKDGNIQGVEGTTRDISNIMHARKELEKHQLHLEELISERTLDLEAANRELESFCYSVSHDLRAPLRSIDGFSQILLEDYDQLLDDVSKDYLQRVRSGAQRMGQLIDDLLKLSRVSSGGLKKETIDLTQMAQEIADGLRQSSQERNAAITIESKLTCYGDKGLIRVVVENLFSNAWKYTQYKQEQTQIEFGQQNLDGTPVFFIKDNGAGFDMKYSNKLFGPFQRLHTAQDFEGSGIGLATVNRIIQRHGGKVWAEGEPDKGATFYFSLPESPAGKP
jgi:PAS domain S-box-containing protein